MLLVWDRLRHEPREQIMTGSKVTRGFPCIGTCLGILDTLAHGARARRGPSAQRRTNLPRYPPPGSPLLAATTCCNVRIHGDVCNRPWAVLSNSSYIFKCVPDRLWAPTVRKSCQILSTHPRQDSTLNATRRIEPLIPCNCRVHKTLAL